MEKNIYAIDACALIDAAKSYNMKISIFKPIWNKLGEMFDSGTLISNSEIFDELKDEELLIWIKPYKKCFLPLDKPTQDKTTEILLKYPKIISLKKGKKGNSNGDPFLIATAIENRCIVVTDEKWNMDGFRIPSICFKYGIECIDLFKFIEIVMNEAA